MERITRQHQVLMVEDTASVAALYKSYLNPLGLNVSIVGSGKEALSFIKDIIPDLILLDLRLPDMTGMEVLQRVRQQHGNIPVVIMTAHGSIDIAVDAIRQGAQDFLIKPCEADRLRITVNNVFKGDAKSSDTPSKQSDGAQYQGFIGNSLPMQAVYRVIESAASSKATVFITGESGTGKEVCAEAIHAASPRHDKPFIALNCAAIPKELIESELFGHVKGAFTGASTERQGAVEIAHNGTLMLDELCEMDLDLQSKLLRFIQTGTYQKVGSSKTSRVDVRFVCATNRNPWQEVQEGRFREDLYYRLHVIPITLPPLRDRGNDIVEIAHALLGLMSLEEGKDFSRFSKDVLQLIESYSWPGNVRELQNIIRNIVVLNTGEEVTKEMVPPPINAIFGAEIASPMSIYPQLNTLTSAVNTSFVDEVHKDKIEPLWIVEKRAIQWAIDACDGNIPRAAGLLEVSPSTIYRKLQTWQEATGSREID
ncbi:quorum-sensing sigma-54 dependent transcriptional regulator LuxO [Photobacterium aquimaris]|uniref:Sigma-54-dependent Fis family transcriptional regulator n=1 Tax=Photobacterium aquimaris TaxID=512643 RepID=A0A2T3I1F5_9GAMM|nr:quorum-sensing sigma-54 dependent transcriptional regulator LuxO [Photobacterium aquimaris]MCP4954429.1 sigma-54-dependent Fis family transcriptional regulator [Photobacterium aquimaris]OBU24611.1 sigma-54-dependent Fis family transcriptional regulator [Photobacterium aquimaris]PQJ41563.1 sigma-54-dependent Fis family transcriptional regulator [Photobacterium aquimaris]PSU10502.1 sigma-54-dependent Fis family transcriptional regulator [Photobacterium aquimaris]